MNLNLLKTYGCLFTFFLFFIILMGLVGLLVDKAIDSSVEKRRKEELRRIFIEQRKEEFKNLIAGWEDKKLYDSLMHVADSLFSLEEYSSSIPIYTRAIKLKNTPESRKGLEYSIIRSRPRTVPRPEMPRPVYTPPVSLDSSTNERTRVLDRKISRLESITEFSPKTSESRYKYIEEIRYLKRKLERISRYGYKYQNREVLSLLHEVLLLEIMVMNSEIEENELTIRLREIEEKVNRFKYQTYTRPSIPTQPELSPPPKDSTNKKSHNEIEIINGHAAYGIPDSVNVNKVARVTLQITNKGTNIAQLKMSTAAYASMPNLKVNNSQISVEEIRLTANMEAILYCPMNTPSRKFIVIKPIGDTLQVINPENNYSALWQWDIIAKKVGEFPLNLKVQGKVDDQKGKSRSINMPVFTKNVIVVAEPNYIRSALISFGALFMLGLGFLLFFKLKRKSSTQTTDNQRLNSKNINQIRDKIQGGNTKQAIEMILNESENLPSKLKNRLSTHLSELKDYNEKYGLGMIDIEEKNKAVNRINHSVLETLGEFEA